MSTLTRRQFQAYLPQPQRCLAAVLLVFVSSANSATMSHASEPPALGRLFNTPQQRAQLDAQRYGTAQSAAPADAAPPAPPLPPPLVLNGVMRPAHGNTTVWLNHEVLPNGQRTVGRDGKVTLTLPSGRRVTLKPGQRYDKTSGEIRDVDQ